jgi:hypothetical protein
MLSYLDTILGFSVVMLGISLIITVLNQLVSALFGHRGSNLRWGLNVLFSQISPGATGLPMLTANARLLSEIVLVHPLASDSTFSTHWVTYFKDARLRGLIRRWQLANAIQPDDLAAILAHIAKFRPPTMPIGLHAMLSAEIEHLLDARNQMALRQGDLANSVVAVVPKGLVQEAVDVVGAASGNLEGWFNKITDRVSQRFTTWMRIWTVLFACAIAIPFCLDSIQLISDIYQNSNLRTQLVGAAPQVVDIAQKTLPPGLTDGSDVVNQGVTQMYTNALKKATADATIPAAVTSVSSESEVLKWIKDNVPDPQKASDIQQRFEANWKAALSGQYQNAITLAKVLKATDLPEFGWDKNKDPWKVLGVLASVFLLSLGAPFWYNALSSLTSLRPILVSKQQSQDQAKLAKQAQPSN